MKNILKVFFKYVHQYCFTIIAFAIFCLIFCITFLLYDLQVETLVYSYLLCLAISVIFVIIHFTRYYQKHIERQKITKNITILSDNLPSSNNLLEQDYKDMVNKLIQINKKLTTTYQNNRQDSIDYYTTWVHQIKTPISVIQIMLQSEDTAEHRELLSQLFRIEQYVEMVLCHFRLDSNSNDFVIKKYSLDSIIKKAVHKYAPLFIRKKLSINYQSTDAYVITDEKWLLFIIEQLLDNAIKYTDKGGITITVTYNNILKISDTGIGIAAENLPRIFEKGFTGYNGRANKKSTGLGLYLCKQAAERLSHSISVTSQVGKGTQFSIDLQSYNFTTE